MDIESLVNERVNTEPTASLLYGCTARPPMGSFEGLSQPMSRLTRPFL